MSAAREIPVRLDDGAYVVTTWNDGIARRVDRIARRSGRVPLWDGGGRAIGLAREVLRVAGFSDRGIVEKEWIVDP